MSVTPILPTAYECSLLLLHLQKTWADEKDSTPTRFRVSESTLKRLSSRPRLHQDFLVEIQDWLLRGGWVLFFAGGSFGMIKLDAVESWTRLGSKRIAEDLDAVSKGEFDFSRLQKLAQPALSAADD